MSTKQKYSSKDEVYDAIYRHGFEHFSGLPEAFLDADIAFQWLKGAGGHVGAHYVQIPQQWRSDELLEFVAREGVNVLKDTSPAQTKNYHALVTLCAVHDYRSLLDVHPKFRNDQAVIKAVCNRYRSSLAKLVNEIDWFGPAMSDDFFDDLCQNDLQFALDVSPRLMRKDIAEYVDLYQQKRTLILRSCGRMYLIADKIAAGGWVDDDIRPEPSSMDEAIGYVLDARPGFYPETLYMGYVMLYPIEKVVPAMKGARLKKLLLEMYSAEALKPFMKRDNVLKGALLDDALGL